MSVPHQARQRGLIESLRATMGGSRVVRRSPQGEESCGSDRRPAETGSKLIESGAIVLGHQFNTNQATYVDEVTVVFR